MRSSLTKDEINQVRASLCRWQRPEPFRQAMSEIHSKVKIKDLFNRPELSFLLDGWVIGEFVSKRVVDEVRLATTDEQWPDGFTKIGENIERIEVTEALERGRRRGDEFKREEAVIEDDPVEDWVKRAGQIPSALEKAITDKVAKRYALPVVLLVYLNISEWGIRQAESEYAIRCIKSRHAASFSGLHILWKDKWF
jgi:hypothetical protein